MITLAVGALFSILGIVIGSLLSASAEYRRWLREERYSRCVRLLTLANNAHNHAVIVGTAYEEIRAASKNRGAPLDRKTIRAARRALFGASKMPKGINKDAVMEAILQSDEVATVIAHDVLESIGKPQDRRSIFDRLTELDDSIIECTEAIKLVCSEEVSRGADSLREALNLVPDSDIDTKKQQRAYDDARVRFIQIAQKELHSYDVRLPRIRARIRPKTNSKKQQEPELQE